MLTVSAKLPKVLLDLRMVRGALHGIARYALELARRLPRLEPGWEFVGRPGLENPATGGGVWHYRRKLP